MSDEDTDIVDVMHHHITVSVGRCSIPDEHILEVISEITRLRAENERLKHRVEYLENGIEQDIEVLSIANIKI